MRLRLRTAIALVFLVALCAPSFAHADAAAVVRDCADGSLTGSYPQKDIAEALANLPADVDEYTDCRDILRRAQLGGAGGSGADGGANGGGFGDFIDGTGGAGGADGAGADPLANATPEERASYERAVAAAVAAGPAAVNLDGRPITAGDAGASTVHALSDLPTPLLVLLALLAAAGLGASGLGARRLVHGRRAV